MLQDQLSKLIDRYSAILFDLDGVITDTARQHARAWKETFEEVLGGSFDIEQDYKLHVDGKPRYEGVQSYLKARQVNLPWGEMSDAPSSKTVCGIGNKKNELVNQLIETEGVDLIAGSQEFVEEARRLGLSTAIVSSSKNCQAVLQSAGIEDLFQVRIDGVIAAQLGLKGKPSPETYLAAAERLEAAPTTSVVVEDAISGVEAGKAGGFGLVIGRGSRELLQHGAHVVVDNLMELIH